MISSTGHHQLKVFQAGMSTVQKSITVPQTLSVLLGLRSKHLERAKTTFRISCVRTVSQTIVVCNHTHIRHPASTESARSIPQHVKILPPMNITQPPSKDKSWQYVKSTILTSFAVPRTLFRFQTSRKQHFEHPAHSFSLYRYHGLLSSHSHLFVVLPPNEVQ